MQYRRVDKDWEEVVSYPCPCCRYKTLHGRNHYEICPVCFWEDDGQDEEEADFVWGGPNGKLSLTHARENFQKYGACEKIMVRHVRKPLLEEMV